MLRYAEIYAINSSFHSNVSSGGSSSGLVVGTAAASWFSKSLRAPKNYYVTKYDFQSVINISVEFKFNTHCPAVH
jgi:hypothetical protein